MENQNKKISIIVPVFNVEDYLCDALESIVRQTIGVEYLEVIMVDDCSTDGSGDVIDEYASKYDNFVAIHLPENSGTAGRPRNVGINEATGDYLMFLDPDDYYADDACETLYNKITEKNVDVVFGKYNIIKENEVVEIDFENKGFKNHVEEVEVKTIDDNPNLLRIPPSVLTKIVKRSIIKLNNIKFPENIPGEDFLFTTDTLMKANGIIFLNNYVVFHYRIRGLNKSVSSIHNKKHVKGLISCYKMILNNLETNKRAEYFPDVCKDHLGYWLKGILSSNLNDDELMEVLEESESLFEKYKGNLGPTLENTVPFLKDTVPLFNLISQKQLEDAITLINSQRLENTQKKSKPIISIIIPVFNVEDYLCDALESIVRQTIGVEYLEVIMVDDCSTDGSGDVIDEYASKYDNFVAIHLPENSGAGGRPRNVGINEATGDYLMFLDPDDYYADDACETLYNKITEKNVDVVFGKYNIIKENEVVEIDFENKGFKNHVEEVEVKTIDDNPNLLRIPPSVWGKIIKRRIVEDNNIIFPEGIPAQDVGFVLHVLLKAKGIIFINKIIVNYRVREESITTTRTKNYLIGLSQAFKYSYDVCCNFNEKYFKYILRDHLINWTWQFILSDTTRSEKMEVLKVSQPLFKKYYEYGLTPHDHLLVLFKSIANKKYDKSIILANNLKDPIKNYEKQPTSLSIKKQKKIFMLCDKVHIKIGGLARVVLERSRILAEKGYDVSILTIEPDNDYEFIEKELKKRGQLFHEVDLVNIYNFYKNKSTRKASLEYLKDVRKALKVFEDGYDLLDEYETKKITRYFKEGNLVKLKKWKNRVLLEYIDYFDENGVRIKRKYYTHGFLTMEVSFQLQDIIRRKKHFTRDGFCYLAEMYNHQGQERELFLFDRINGSVLSFENSTAFHKYFLTELCKSCENKPYLICDGSGPTPTISNIDPDVAYTISQLHSNPYIGPYSFGGPMREIGILDGIGEVYAFITLTEKQRKDIIKQFGDYKNTYTLPNFVSKIGEVNIETKSNKISIFTRISPEKNLESAIRSFRLVVNKRKDARLEIFGRATLPGELNELEKIKKLIKELQLENNVFIKGYITDVNEEMGESVATLLTSKFEGFGMVIIESMLNSTPVISYNIHYGPSDIIDHGIDGFLVEYNNIEQMANYIVELLDDTEKAKKMGAAARKKVLKNYTDDVVIPQWEELFEVIPNNPPMKNKLYNNQKVEAKNTKKSQLSTIKNEKRTDSSIFSKVYPLYILFNKKNNGFKNTLLNLKGYRAIKRNNLFDTEYYLTKNNDVQKSGMDPILHYMYHGFKEGRKPNSTFDGNYYLNVYGDVRKSSLNPLVHYSLYGRNENRKTNNF